MSTKLDWPKLPVIDPERLAAAEALARLAIELRAGQANKDPSSFLTPALELLKKADKLLLDSRREVTEAEFLIDNDGSQWAVSALLERRDGSRPRIPFKSVADEDRKCNDHEDITVPLKGGADRKISWRMYSGKLAHRSFERFFWRYTDWISKQPHRYDAEGARISFKNERIDPLQRKANWSMTLKEWKSAGIPHADFLSLVRYRREIQFDKFPKKTAGAANASKTKQPSRKNGPAWPQKVST